MQASFLGHAIPSWKYAAPTEEVILVSENENATLKLSRKSEETMRIVHSVPVPREIKENMKMRICCRKERRRIRDEKLLQVDIEANTNVYPKRRRRIENGSRKETNTTLLKIGRGGIEVRFEVWGPSANI